MDLKQPISIHSYASGLGAGISGCESGPVTIQQTAKEKALFQDPKQFQWEPLVQVENEAELPRSDHASLAALCQNLAKQVSATVKDKRRFLVIGGDHTCAVGTWSGVSHALGQPETLGLIWVDAHMDCHTVDTTPSQNVHGMPLAALLGHGSPLFTQVLTDTPKLVAKHAAQIGLRSYEPEEIAFHKAQGTTAVFMPDVQKNGFAASFKAVVDKLSQTCTAIGISLDVDVLDPSICPGVGSDATGGLFLDDLKAGLMYLKGHPLFIGAEIVEFNPTLDKDHQTRDIVIDLISLFSEV